MIKDLCLKLQSFQKDFCGISNHKYGKAISRHMFQCRYTNTLIIILKLKKLRLKLKALKKILEILEIYQLNSH